MTKNSGLFAPLHFSPLFLACYLGVKFLNRYRAMSIRTDGIDPVVESSGDKAHRVARAVIGMSPILSGTAVEVLNALIEPPLEKRKREWMLEITSVVNDLQNKFNLNIDDLVNNEQFISILLHTSQIAIKNHHKEKITALKVALLNTARNEELSDDQQFIFLRLLDEFTVPHVKILESTALGFCWSPRTKESSHSTWLEFSRVLLGEFEEFKDKADLLYQIVSDLESKKLLRTFKVQQLQDLPNNEISVMGTSEWGQFLSFKPAKHHRLDKDSNSIYVTLPTQLGVDFLNYVLCDE
jgi:uncharacterized protein YlxP (DUF503 family)